MNLTEKEKSELLSVYNAYWDCYLNGDVETMSEILDDNYTQVGSAEDEVFLNKEEAVQFLQETIDQVAGNLEMRDRVTIPEYHADQVMIHERCDVYARNESEWIFYAKFRATTLMRKTKTGWKFLHQHSSFPDPRTGEGENINIDEVAAENRRLKKAVEDRTRELEQKNRALEIEASLERVRSRSMAMHQSSEMLEVAHILFQEIRSLGGELWGSGVILCNPDSEIDEVWFANENGILPPIEMLNSKDPTHLRMYQGWKKDLELYQETMDGADLEKHYQNMLSIPSVRPLFENILASGLTFPKKQTWYAAYFQFGYILTITLEPYPRPEILTRFAKVFDQAYTRFLDLKKAEQQARDAQIEAALERVRARAMAMHKTDELTDVLCVLFEQFDVLGIKPVLTHLTLFDEENETFTLRITTSAENRVIAEQLIDVNAVEAWKQSFANWKKSELHAIDLIDYPPESLPMLWDVLDEVMNALPDDHKIHPEDFPDGLYTTQGHCKYGYIGLNHTRRATEEEKQIVIRFAKEFGRLYQRFLDLQIAEEQAREAQIQLALERVRARTMAMHQSEELAETASVLFEQFEELGGNPDRMNICIFNEEEHILELWSTELGGKLISKSHSASLDEPTTIAKFYRAWKANQKSVVVRQEGKQLAQWIDFVQNEMGLELMEDRVQKQRFQTGALFSKGLLILTTNDALPEDMILLLERFAQVFNLTYTRFLDLKKAEAQARIAQIEASLERVRAEIASMRTTEDLQRITPLIWRELTTLDVPFFRCGVFIMDETAQIVHVHLSDPSGNPLGAMHLPFDAGELTIETIKSWRKKEVFTKHWDKEAFVNWMQLMHEMGQLQDSSIYQGSETAPESLDLHFIPFKQGMLYVGNDTPLGNDKIELVQSLAEAFSIAYSRYEDFVRIEQAKQQLEKTLADLKQAQTQLIHSEKMASLGELTAGIAHEIQNPLNFVNNFSEVSNELIEEMYEELEKGDLEEAIAIGQDIKQNLEKINHHGKRADRIVKGMLQHSRTSAATKEPTDLNKLADEYLRLAYHGLRAKDKSFNVQLETKYDSSIPAIEVIPQEIGRVILNLVTNAFYAVSEKKARLAENDISRDYEPIVSLVTKKAGRQVVISVWDNGNGIPEKVRDKIFQPFFTTKPTGQGTGLGLSLSYDIIRAHEGSMEVDTEAGQFTELRILLPLHNGHPS